VFHVSGTEPNRSTELMFNTAALADAVTGPNRICDGPLQLNYEIFNPAQPTPGAFNLNSPISLVDRIRLKGDPTMEDW
jgi:hypothetical protein